MAKQQPKRSMWDSREPPRSSVKKHKPHAMAPNGIGRVKQEPGEVQQQEEAEEGEVCGEVVAVATAEIMDEPQINLRFGVSRFHCLACLRPIKPPTFKCEATHLVCGTCRADHAQACGRAATYTACPEVDIILGDAKLPCPYSEFGCKSIPVYYQAADHERGCQWAPCYCPDPGCKTYTSPAGLVEHFRAGHGWPVTEVAYGKPCELALPRPPPHGPHALVEKEDRRVFLVSASALGAAVAVTLVCLQANDDVAPGFPQFKCTLWVASRRSTGDMVCGMFSVARKDMRGGFVAAEHGSFLTVTPDLMRDVSGAAPVLKVRIDRVTGGGGTGGAAARSPTPSVSRSGSGRKP